MLPQEQEFSLFATVSRQALRPTHPHIESVPGAISLRVKQPGHAADHSPSAGSRLRMCGAIPVFPHKGYIFMVWHGMVLS
jgi:hypothetical protein